MSGEVTISYFGKCGGELLIVSPVTFAASSQLLLGLEESEIESGLAIGGAYPKIRQNSMNSSLLSAYVQLTTIPRFWSTRIVISAFLFQTSKVTGSACASAKLTEILRTGFHLCSKTGEWLFRHVEPPRP